MLKILFICKHNTARSILAEAIARRQLPSSFQVVSGGSEPAEAIDPRIASYLEDLGIDPNLYRSESVDKWMELKPDVVICVCDLMHGEAMPDWIGDGVRASWDLEAFPGDDVSDEEFRRLCELETEHLVKRFDEMARLDLENCTRHERKQFLMDLRFL